MVEKERECEKDELEEDPDSQMVSSDVCHSHRIEGFWELYFLGFLTLCVRTSSGSVVRGVFGSVKAAAHEGELLHNVFHSPLVHSLPEHLLAERVFLLIRDA